MRFLNKWRLFHSSLYDGSFPNAWCGSTTGNLLCLNKKLMVAIFAVIAHLMPFQDATRQEQRRPILTVVTQEGNITKHEIVLCSIGLRVSKCFSRRTNFDHVKTLAGQQSLPPWVQVGSPGISLRVWSSNTPLRRLLVLVFDLSTSKYYVKRMSELARKCRCFYAEG